MCTGAHHVWVWMWKPEDSTRCSSSRTTHRPVNQCFCFALRQDLSLVCFLPSWLSWPGHWVLGIWHLCFPEDSSYKPGNTVLGLLFYFIFLIQVFVLAMKAFSNWVIFLASLQNSGIGGGGEGRGCLCSQAFYSPVEVVKHGFRVKGHVKSVFHNPEATAAKNIKKPKQNQST